MPIASLHCRLVAEQRQSPGLLAPSVVLFLSSRLLGLTGQLQTDRQAPLGQTARKSTR